MLAAHIPAVRGVPQLLAVCEFRQNLAAAATKRDRSDLPPVETSSEPPPSTMIRVANSQSTPVSPQDSRHHAHSDAVADADAAARC